MADKTTHLTPSLPSDTHCEASTGPALDSSDSDSSSVHEAGRTMVPQVTTRHRIALLAALAALLRYALQLPPHPPAPIEASDNVHRLIHIAERFGIESASLKEGHVEATVTTQKQRLYSALSVIVCLVRARLVLNGLQLISGHSN